MAARERPIRRPASVRHPDGYWDDLSILYVPKFAYEEVLAVFGNRPDDPSNLNLLAHSKRLTEVMTGTKLTLRPIGRRRAN